MYFTAADVPLLVRQTEQTKYFFATWQDALVLMVANLVLVALAFCGLIFNKCRDLGKNLTV